MALTDSYGQKREPNEGFSNKELGPEMPSSDACHVLWQHKVTLQATGWVGMVWRNGRWPGMTTADLLARIWYSTASNRGISRHTFLIPKFLIWSCAIPEGCPTLVIGKTLHRLCAICSPSRTWRFTVYVLSAVPVERGVSQSMCYLQSQ